MAIPNWLSVNQLNGSGDTVVTISASTNSELVERTTNLLISGVTKYVNVEVEQRPDSTYNYLTMIITQGGVVTWTSFMTADAGYTAPDCVIQFRRNGGAWTDITATTAGTEIGVLAGDKLEFKGNHSFYSYQTGTYSGYYGFKNSTAHFELEGNIMSMFYGDNFADKTSFPEYTPLGGTGRTCSSMFRGCTGLTDASNLALPATAVYYEGYALMFSHCENLLYGPELPATSVGQVAYAFMFGDCTSMIKGPTTIPLSNANDSCCWGMFQNCSSLISAPSLPATTVNYRCYEGMFENCTSLENAPSVLPALTLDKQCYMDMFAGCTSLTKAPDLPAPVLGDRSYFLMFSGCRNLSSIKCLATDISEENCTWYWVNNVSQTGTFTKASSMSSWTSGVHGIPIGWTVVDAT